MPRIGIACVPANAIDARAHPITASYGQRETVAYAAENLRVQISKDQRPNKSSTHLLVLTMTLSDYGLILRIVPCVAYRRESMLHAWRNPIWI